jgi:hypothetical protein
VAITYFAITSTDPGGTHNIDLPEVVGDKVFGVARLWYNTTPPTPTAKWIVLGENIALADSPRLRAISTQRKAQILQEMQRWLDLSRSQLSDYGIALGRNFRVELQLSQSLVDAV